MKSSYKCYCAKYNRIKFRGITCGLCRTEVLVKEPPRTIRFQEMTERLLSDYYDVTSPRAAIMLTAHHFRLLTEH